jgi:hypothetical protein
LKGKRSFSSLKLKLSNFIGMKNTFYTNLNIEDAFESGLKWF